MQKEFYLKFPAVLRDALVSGEVSFCDGVECEFETFSAYRGVFRKDGNSFKPLARSDFDSQAEKSLNEGHNEKRKNRRKIDNGAGFYSCSMFINLEEISKALKFPQKDRRIALGPVSMKNGCIRCSCENSHVDWWLYKDTDEFWKEYNLMG